MPTECNERSFDFQPLGSREVTARFDGGTITSDAGGLLAAGGRGEDGFARRPGPLLRRPPRPRASSSTPSRNCSPSGSTAWPWATRTSTTTTTSGPTRCWRPSSARPIPRARHRRRQRDRGKALAGKSTLNRLELTPVGADAREPLQEDRLPHPRRRTPLRDALPPGPARAARADRARPRRHRRPDPRPPARPLLPRLLQGLLLPAAVHLLRRPPALRPAAARGHRRRGGVGQATRGSWRRSASRGQTCGSSRGPPKVLMPKFAAAAKLHNRTSRSTSSRGQRSPGVKACVFEESKIGSSPR